MTGIKSDIRFVQTLINVFSLFDAKKIKLLSFLKGTFIRNKQMRTPIGFHVLLSANISIFG